MYQAILIFDFLTRSWPLMPSDALTTPAADVSNPIGPQPPPDFPKTPTTRRNAPSLAEVLSTPAARGTASQQNAYTREDISPYILEDFKTSRIYLSFEMFLRKVMNLPDDWESDANFKACVDKLETDVELREKLDAYFVECDVKKHAEDALYVPAASVFNRATDVLAALDGIAQDDTVYVYRQDNKRINGSRGRAKYSPDLCTTLYQLWRTSKNNDHLAEVAERGPPNPVGYGQLIEWMDLKAVPALLDGGVGAHAVLDKDGKDPRDEKNMNQARREAVKSDGRSLTSRFSNATGKKRPSTSHAESSTSKKLKSQPPSNAAKSAHQYSQPHSQQITYADDSADRLKTSYQCADYALQFMSDGGLRNHSFGNLICDDRLQLLYYDHSCIAVAKPLDMRLHRRMLMLYLVCLHKLSFSDRSGIPNASILQNPKPYLTEYSDYAKVDEDWYNILLGQVLLLEDQTGSFEVTLGRIIDRQTGIIGRCTYIVNATCAKWPGMELIVKITWSPTSRSSEAEFMQSVQEAVSKTGADWVLDHVPNILHSQDFPHLPDEVGGRLSAFLNNLDEDHWASDPGDFDYEERVMRVSVHEKLFKLSELDTVLSHSQVFHDVVQVHRWLYDYPRILHRDISLGNIMWRVRRNRVCGVLNDFDLSSFRDSTKPSSKQRTGTRPYMARELQNPDDIPPKHLYRHDLESLFYALLLLAGAHVLLENPTTASITQERQFLQVDLRSQYRTWMHADEVLLYSEKSKLMGRGVTMYTHESFVALQSRLQDLRNYLALGVSAQTAHDAQLSLAQPSRPVVRDIFKAARSGLSQNPNSRPRIPTFDDETLGGHWSYTRFLEVLDMPFEVMYPVPRPDIAPSPI